MSNAVVTQENYEALQREYSEFRETSEELEATLELELGDLRKELEAVQAELDAMRNKRRREMREHSDETDKCNHTIEALQKQVATLKRSVRDLETGTERSDKLVKILEHEVATAKAIAEEAAEELVLVKSEKEVAQNDVRAAERESQHLRKELKEKDSALPPPKAAEAETPANIDTAQMASFLKSLSDSLVASSRLHADWVVVQEAAEQGSSRCVA
eukprot:TRINITY_DN33086_c0_g1_i1.p1 TRINITY_DN33086_c0_g1~~TRINITY_DN33086_c0_g1_i1.p1  ORF type:complete len:216 (+),score=72.81 TRINITY_DN33086_c0_g1_i1:45-692(+)